MTIDGFSRSGQKSPYLSPKSVSKDLSSSTLSKANTEDMQKSIESTHSVVLPILMSEKFKESQNGTSEEAGSIALSSPRITLLVPEMSSRKRPRSESPEAVVSEVAVNHIKEESVSKNDNVPSPTQLNKKTQDQVLPKEADRKQGVRESSEKIGVSTSSVAIKNVGSNFIIDSYTEARGEPKMLEISCSRCHSYVMDYQKDGPGRLLRCYADRIRAPESLKNRVFTVHNARNIPNLKCGNCRETLAEPFIYRRRFPKPEERPAYRILDIKKYDRRIPAVEICEKKA